MHKVRRTPGLTITLAIKVQWLMFDLGTSKNVYVETPDAPLHSVPFIHTVVGQYWTVGTQKVSQVSLNGYTNISDRVFLLLFHSVPWPIGLKQNIKPLISLSQYRWQWLVLRGTAEQHRTKLWD
jgi:hypothetical protein